MTRATGSIKTESRRSIRNEKKPSYLEENDDSYSLLKQREITITVESIENIDPKKVKEVVVRVEFAGDIIAQSFQTPITNSKVDIGLSACISTEDVNPQFMDEIVSHPVLFTILDCTSFTTSTVTSITSPNLEKDMKRKTSKASNSPLTASKSFTTVPVLGICNFDIGSLALGRTRIKKILVLEPDKKVTPSDQVSWVKLPKLAVTAHTGKEPLIPHLENKFNNIIGVTVESVYNIPEYISEGSLFDANILVPSLGDKGNSVKFPGGVAVSLKDASCRKKWLSLLHIEGQGARSKHSVSPRFCDVTSTLPEHLILENEINKSSRLIQWNILKNSFMIKKDVNYFYSKIMKYRIWPIEISIPSKSKELLTKDKSAKSDKKSKPAPSAAPTNADHFTAFLDLSPLLYPGVTKVRIASQLYTYSQKDLINKCGWDFPTSNSQASVVNGKMKTTSERSKASVREPEENKDSPGLPIFNDEGAPTFIIVEMELQKPFTPKRNTELIETNLKDQISLKGTIKKKPTNSSLIFESFSKAIKDIVSIIAEEHQEFSLLYKNGNSGPDENFDVAFQKFLYTRENFFKIKATLENKVIELVTEKYGASLGDKFEEKIPEIYVYLVNEMHKITNGYLLGQENFSNIYFNTNDLQLYAEEALAEGDYEAARDYLLLKLSRETSNPDYWMDCAVCCIGLNRYEAAVEAVREALNLNFHHQMGLLTYALLMARLNNGTLAEQAFQVLLVNYPDFIEGWMALRLFYSAMNNPEGAFVAKQMAIKLECEERCKKTSVPEELTEESNFQCKIYQHDQKYEASGEEKYGIASFRNGISWSEPLSWSVSLCPPNNINLRTLIVLLKLGFYEYGSMSLSQELLSSGANEESLPPVYVYYSSVNLYLEGRYEEAIPVLLNFVKTFGKDCLVWSLLGHCYYKMENHAKAISCYEYVMESYNRPDDIHLIYLRMGMYYIQTKKFFCAKQVFITACKYSPTPKLWKGLGIACLRMNELEDAEIAFSEANYLDYRDPESWAYLAITNAMSRRLDLFNCCFLEAKKDLFINLPNLTLCTYIGDQVFKDNEQATRWAEIGEKLMVLSFNQHCDNTLSLIPSPDENQSAHL